MDALQLSQKRRNRQVVFLCSLPLQKAWDGSQAEQPPISCNMHGESKVVPTPKSFNVPFHIWVQVTVFGGGNRRGRLSSHPLGLP